MQGTLFFVHGTGVRQAGYDATLTAIRDGCRRSGMEGVDVAGVPWGARFGAPVEAIERTLPPEAVTRDAFDRAGISEADVEAAHWAILIDDPLFELRLVAESGEQQSAGVVVGGTLPDQAADEGVRRVKDAPPDLTGTGLTPGDLSAAADHVIGTPELHGAALAVGDAADPDLVEAMARAVVAAVLAAHRLDLPGTEPAAALNGAIRNELVTATMKVIAPQQTRGIGGWLKKRVAAYAVKRATAEVLERRSPLQGAATPGIGDILHYQRRGDQIVEFVSKGLEGRRRPVVAVGHSLGGIVLVDTLSRRRPPPVDLLVTVGSQSPMFYAIDALEVLRPGGPDAPFKPWLNIYNRRDFLSFVARGVWPGATGLTDVEVDPGVPFPQSHSAYWHDDRTYALIRDAWPR